MHRDVDLEPKQRTKPCGEKYYALGLRDSARRNESLWKKHGRQIQHDHTPCRKRDGTRLISRKDMSVNQEK